MTEALHRAQPAITRRGILRIPFPAAVRSAHRVIAAAPSPAFPSSLLPAAEPIAASRAFWRHYRMDAAVLLFSAPVFTRRGVGEACALVEEATSTTAAMKAVQFASGSRPEKARGLNRLGFIQETTIRRQDGAEESAYFGFMTASEEKDLTEARRSLFCGTGPALPYFVSQGFVHRGRFDCARRRVELPAAYTWRHFRQIADMVRSDLADAQPALAVSEMPLPALSDTPRTFLHSVLASMREKDAHSEKRFIHSGRLYSLSAEKRTDDRAGRTLAQRGLAIRPERVVRLVASIRNRGTRERSGFTLWFEQESEDPLPLRFQFQPRSFLRLVFEWDPALVGQPLHFLLATGDA